MKKTSLKGLVILLTVLLTACSNEPESAGTPETVEPSTDTTIEKETKEQEQPEGVFTETDAISVAKSVIDDFNKLLNDMGQEHQWNFENPGDYDVAKPELLKLATEQFSEEMLKEYIETYYCNCDSVWRPELSHSIRLTIDDLTNESFSIDGVNLGNYIRSSEEVNFKFVREGDTWKLDGWDNALLQGKDLKLTADEIENGMPGSEVKGEYQSEVDGGLAYKVLLNDGELMGISSKDGSMLAEHVE